MLKKLMLAVPYLTRDFFEQSWLIKMMLGFAWLCMLVMLCSILLSG